MTRDRRGVREGILAAAAGLLDRGGETAVTLRAVARAAGISAPSVYPHFPDRRAVLDTALRAAADDLARQVRAAGRAEPDPVAGLQAAGRAYLGFAVAHPGHYRSLPVDSATGWPVLRVLTDLLATCVAAGRSTSTDPAADGLALWLGLHGLAHQCSVYRAVPLSTDYGPGLITALARTA